MAQTLLTDYPHRLGGHCGSSALRDLMHWYQLGWNGPPSEGLVFTLGGALDFTYVRTVTLTPPIYLVGRGGDLELDLVRRLGGQVTMRATDDPDEGWRWIRDEIDAGRPVLAWADIAELPYLRVRLRMSRHDIVLIGYDDEQQVVHVVDNDRADTQLVPYDALAKARSSTGFPEPTRHTIYDVTWPTNVGDLRAAAADAFQRSADAMTMPSCFAIAGPNTDPAATGLQAVHDFSLDIERWAEVFEEPALDLALKSLTAFIEKAGTGGGLFRQLLAQGCSDIAHQIDDPSLPPLTDAVGRAATAWTALAAAAATGDDPHTRWRAAATAAQQLPELEAALVDRLAQSARALTGPHHQSELS